MEMEMAKLTSAGQVTIPVNIRRKLHAKKGDKLIFFEQNGQIILTNASLLALEHLQKSFIGVAEDIGVSTEADVVCMMKAFRQELAEDK